MQYICHRINNSSELENIPHRYGVELDLRDDLNGRIYIEHNPFTDGEDFENYLKNYSHGTMILNIKSERIEEKVLELVKKYGVKSYFFLDSSFPMIYSLSSSGIRDFALRFSEFEGPDTLVSMQGKVGWVWVDCFTRMPLDKEIYSRIKEMGYRICIVSPELQAQPEKIETYAKQLESEGVKPDAICTKVYNIAKWCNYFPE